jgi:hypothetical protein
MSQIVAFLKHENVLFYVTAAVAIGFLTFALT